jgi:hypothetical protein
MESNKLISEIKGNISNCEEIKNPDKIITLKTPHDQKSIKIDRKSLRHLKLIHETLMDFEDYEEIDVPSDPHLNFENLSYIVEYATHYRNTEPPVVGKPLIDYSISFTYGKWEEEFVSKFLKTENDDTANIFSLMKGADCIQCYSLVELIASHIACIIKDLSGKQWLDFFGLKEDMTQEEVQQMEEEYRNKRLSNN